MLRWRLKRLSMINLITNEVERGDDNRKERGERKGNYWHSDDADNTDLIGANSLSFP